MERIHVRDFLIGLGMGAATGLLFAPQAGKQTRARITEVATDEAARVKDCGETVSDAVSGFIDRGMDEIARHKEGVTEAVKRGTQVYRQTVS